MYLRWSELVKNKIKFDIVIWTNVDWYDEVDHFNVANSKGGRAFAKFNEIDLGTRDRGNAWF